MAVSEREQALSLLAAANNHGDVAVKLSSLKQAKDILLSASDTAIHAELYPYLVELQSSHDVRVRKALVEGIEELGLKAMEHSSILMPVVLKLLNDEDSVVARQSIVAGSKLFCSVVEALALQFHRRGIIERWLEELWMWMVKFKDAVFQIPLEAGSVGPKLLAIRFLETFVVLFTSDNEFKQHNIEALSRSEPIFNISWLIGGHPVLDPVALTSDANRSFCVLLDLLRSAGSLPGSVTISVINSLSSIVRKRPVHYSTVLSTFLEFDAKFDTSKGIHIASVQYSLRTSFLGFLRCTFPAILESRDKLVRALRAMNAGDAADQAMRQVDKLLRNSERASRDARLAKDEQTSSTFNSGDPLKKRPTPMDQDQSIDGSDTTSKRIRYVSNTNGTVQDHSVNGASHKVPPLDSSDLTPVEQMIAMIGALIAEGERGAKSLEILISSIHPDLLADIVITNMKHLPSKPPPVMDFGSMSATRQDSNSNGPAQAVALPQYSDAMATSVSETSTAATLPVDSKRELRRDPRRLDPRRVALPAVPPDHMVEDRLSVSHTGAVESDLDASTPLKNQHLEMAEVTYSDITHKTETDLCISEGPAICQSIPTLSPKDDVLDEESNRVGTDPDFSAVSAVGVSPVHGVEESKPSDIVMTDEELPEIDHLSPSDVEISISEEACTVLLPELPSFIELTDEQQRHIKTLAVERIIGSYKQLQGTDFMQTRMSLLARLVAQISDDDDMVVMMIQKHVVSDYHQQKGHEVAMHVLYHLHTLMTSDSVETSSFVAVVYEKFLLGLAKSLLDALPSTDKSFSRLLSEAPFLPNSALKLLDDICCSESCTKDVRDGDRITQGLGSLWSLILGRPVNRQACLDIALKCAVHSQDDIRTKAIRLVANKLYVIDCISKNIEDFATNKLLSAVDISFVDPEPSQVRHTEERMGMEIGSKETSISGSHISEEGNSENETSKCNHPDSLSDSSISFSEAQCHLSLFFALCTKKPGLLQLVFDKYANAPKGVKQAIHRHVPILVRALGSSYFELLRIISNPPEGSENLLTQVLHILSEATPSAELTATVKHLYETKIKDVAILIPMLPSFTKNEVLPIFPRLVNLPLDKFQTALAHILQGSAHSGPALTPAEVLVAIHDISPEKDGVPLKKITEVCSACFEQRTVFTQQVLAKALGQMVDRATLPLLFMRTVIQAIDAFPKLVDFVMELLSKLVSKQIWRMPKLWVGFLKCVSQTQPRSFNVLLQLPAAQLDSALSKYANLRGPLSSYAMQPSIKASLSRSTLQVLGLVNESHMQQAQVSSALLAADKSSITGAI